MENLWDISTVCTRWSTTDNIKAILEEQAQYLKDGTNGKVLAKYRRLPDIFTNTIRASHTASSSKTGSKSGKNISDADILYKTQCYGFEIHNDFYKFRMFEIKLSPLYPVSIFFDEGVLEDIEDQLLVCSKKGKWKNEYILQSDEEFISSLSAAFTCKKVQFLISKLREL